MVKPNINDDETKLYFVVETKGSLFAEDRKETENLKIKCGEEHFKALEGKIGFRVATGFDNFMNKL